MKTDKLLEHRIVETILSCEGAVLLSLGLTQDYMPVLEIWADTNEAQDFNLYGYAFIRKEDVEPFINKEKSYFHVLKDCCEIVTFKYNETAYDFQVMAKEDFIKNYGPREDADLEPYLSDFRQSNGWLQFKQVFYAQQLYEKIDDSLPVKNAEKKPKV